VKIILIFQDVVKIKIKFSLNVCALCLFILNDYITTHGETNITLEHLTEYERIFYIKF